MLFFKNGIGIKIQPALFYDKRSILYPFADGHDIFAKEAHKSQLNTTHEENGDHRGGVTGREAVPVDEFGNQIEQSDQEADKGHAETGKFRNAHADFGIAGKTDNSSINNSMVYD